MGYAMPPGDPDRWKSFPPHEKINMDFIYSGGGYITSIDEGNIEWNDVKAIWN